MLRVTFRMNSCSTGGGDSTPDSDQDYIIFLAPYLGMNNAASQTCAKAFRSRGRGRKRSLLEKCRRGLISDAGRHLGFS